jgi:hypothetical protein
MPVGYSANRWGKHKRFQEVLCIQLSEVARKLTEHSRVSINSISQLTR